MRPTETGPLDLEAAIGALARQIVAEVDALDEIDDEEDSNATSIASGKIRHLCESLTTIAKAHEESSVRDMLAAEKREREARS